MQGIPEFPFIDEDAMFFNWHDGQPKGGTFLWRGQSVVFVVGRSYKLEPDPLCVMLMAGS